MSSSQTLSKVSLLLTLSFVSIRYNPENSSFSVLFSPEARGAAPAAASPVFACAGAVTASVPEVPGAANFSVSSLPLRVYLVSVADCGSPEVVFIT